MILASPSVVHGGCGCLTVTLLPFLLQTKFVNDALEKENDALERENERLDQHAQLLEQLSARVADSGGTLLTASSLSFSLLRGCGSRLRSSSSSDAVDEVESVLKSLVSRRERLMTLIREAQQLDVETPPERVCTRGLVLVLVPPLSCTREFSWLTSDEGPLLLFHTIQDVGARHREHRKATNVELAE